MAVMPRYIPWLFDDEVAWKKAVSDSRYNYMMPFQNFVALYQEYRTGRVANFEPKSTPVMPTASSGSGGSSSSSSESSKDAASQILDQNEIDSLIASMT